MKNIRNFSIIAHIDHGKSTLVDRFLELTGTVPKEKMRPQFLDMMDLEREKGITIKMQPVQMSYVMNSEPYTLNLIDTPGHVDFSYEVSRSLTAVEAAVLLVDATKGIQAQTIANLELARKQNLVIIPAINKIDLATARIEQVLKEMAPLLKIKENEILKISAKEGTNIKELLETIIKRTPPPKTDIQKKLRVLIFDSKYDDFKGVLAFVRIVEGEALSGQEIYSVATKFSAKIKEVGYFKPDLVTTTKLSAGEIGYIATGIKDPQIIRVGDTITGSKLLTEPLPGYKEPKPVVFASLYPENPEDYDLLKKALAKLKLNDASLVFETESKEMLGRGFRCGFLGTLHAEISSERLRREFGLNLIISTPSVLYKIIDKKNNEILVYSAKDWPDSLQIEKIREPWVSLEIITPVEYLGRVMEILESIKGKHVETKHFGKERVFLTYEIPLREVIVGFHDKLKGATQGYASMNYEILDYREADLVKLEILIASELEEAFSRVVPRALADKEGRKILKKLKEILPAQQFLVSLQAVVEDRIIARENISAKRRDVTAPLYGGDYTRKRKLLERQKKGKKELKERGKVRIPSRVFVEMFRD